MEENVFRELEIPIPPDMVDDDDDEGDDDEGDDDAGDASSSSNSGGSSSSGHRGQHQRQRSGETSAMRATASASATAAAAAAARGHDGGFPSSIEGVSERVSGLRQRDSASVLGSRGSGDGRRRGLLVPLEGSSRRSRVTNGDIIRQFRQSAQATTADAASHAHPSGSRSMLVSARGRGGNNTERAALQSMAETSEGDDHDAPQAVTSSAGSTVTTVTSSSPNLGFAVFCDETDKREVTDPPSGGVTSSTDPPVTAVTSSSSSLGFAVFRDEDDDADPGVADAPLAERPMQAALGFSVAQDAMDEDVVDNDMDQHRGGTAEVASDLHRFSRDFGGRFGTDEPRKASGGQRSLRPSMEDVAQTELTYFEDDEGVEGLSTLSFFDDSPVRHGWKLCSMMRSSST